MANQNRPTLIDIIKPAVALHNHNIRNTHDNRNNNFNAIRESINTTTASKKTTETEDNSSTNVQFIDNKAHSSPSHLPGSVSPLLSSSASSLSVCACTNISIMQLFHEMKQKFPTVPDHIVNQCVLDYCHNRPKCMQQLTKEAIDHAGIVQSYPGQIYHQRRTMSDEQLAAPAVAPTVISSSPSPQPQPPLTYHRKPPQRPTQLNLHSDLRQQLRHNFIQHQQHQQGQHQQQHQIPLQRPVPTRPAPPPPPQTLMTPNSDDGRSKSNGTSILSLNVIVSPSSAVGGIPQSPITQLSNHPIRHTSRLSMPASEVSTPCSLLSTSTASGCGSSNSNSSISSSDGQQRSYTSVNLTLRQPIDLNCSAQSPIDISVGPSLTYSSASYDARAGYQSRFQITVGGGSLGVGGGGSSGGSISAARIRPTLTPTSAPTLTPTPTSVLRCVNKGWPLPIPPPMSAVTSIGSNQTCQIVDECDDTEGTTVRRQLDCKERLSSELDNDRRRLELMQWEIQALQLPRPRETLMVLQNEIERLQFRCEQMASEVEKAGPSYALGETDEHIYKKQHSIDVNRLIRPPRPPPPNNLRTVQPAIPNPAAAAALSTNYENELPWNCHICTFRNHPLLDKCEQCEISRLHDGNDDTNDDQNEDDHNDQYNDRTTNTHILHEDGQSTVFTSSGDNIFIEFSPGHNQVIFADFLHSWHHS